jgi:RNase P subunit RPR2
MVHISKKGRIVMTKLKGELKRIAFDMFGFTDVDLKAKNWQAERLVELTEQIASRLTIKIPNDIREFIWERCQADDYDTNEIIDKLTQQSQSIITVKE